MIIVVFVHSQYGDEYKSMNGQRIDLKSFSLRLRSWTVVPRIDSIFYGICHVRDSVKKNKDCDCVFLVHLQFVANYREIKTGSDFWSVGGLEG